MIDRTCTARRGALATAILAVVIGLALAQPAEAKTLRWAGRGDMQTTDPHAQNENLTNNINILVYEPLLDRDKKLGIVPALAQSWTQVNPTTWRFKLRPGVRFHDGTPFTADDVVFSFERAGPTRRNYASTPTLPGYRARSTTSPSSSRPAGRTRSSSSTSSPSTS